MKPPQPARMPLGNLRYYYADAPFRWPPRGIAMPFSADTSSASARKRRRRYQSSNSRREKMKKHLLLKSYATVERRFSRRRDRSAALLTREHEITDDFGNATGRKSRAIGFKRHDDCCCRAGRIGACRASSNRRWRAQICASDDFTPPRHYISAKPRLASTRAGRQSYHYLLFVYDTIFLAEIFTCRCCQQIYRPHCLLSPPDSSTSKRMMVDARRWPGIAKTGDGNYGPISMSAYHARQASRCYAALGAIRPLLGDKATMISITAIPP